MSYTIHRDITDIDTGWNLYMSAGGDFYTARLSEPQPRSHWLACVSGCCPKKLRTLLEEMPPVDDPDDLGWVRYTLDITIERGELSP